MSTCTHAADEAAYLLGTHDAELERLGAQHHLWRAYAVRCWQRAGIGSGMGVLDVGCGPGFATLDLAALVGVTGRVVAVDQSARFVDHLTRRAGALGLDTIETGVMDVQHLDLPAASMDAAYARWGLGYVPDPDAVLRGVARTLRPGGVFAVQDYAHVSGQTIAPPSAAFARVAYAMAESWRQSGGDPQIGLRLPALMERHGLRVEAINPIQRIARPGTPLWEWPGAFFRNYVPVLVERGLLSMAEHHAFEHDWTARSGDASALMWLPPMIEVIARKP